MTDDTATPDAPDTQDEADRVARLEAELDRLREQVETQREALSLLVAAQQSDTLPNLGCPYCEDGTLVGSSGLSYTQIACNSCDFSEYL
jgi:hypothetical protein